ncbi:MAG: alpha/beta fold hydrolase [Bacteroidota bacterium]
MRVLLLVPLVVLVGCTSSGRLAETEPRELVVLVHGMGRTQFSMVSLQVRLNRAGYRTLNVGYSSFGPDIADIAEDVGEAVSEAVERHHAPRVHFVTHSLGGIVVRYLAETDPPSRMGRVVMLAPPNQGSHEADRFSTTVGWLLRPMHELRTEASTIARLGPMEGVEVAVIAGDRDGKVTVEESRLEGAEHVVVRSGHTFIMAKPSVARTTACFFQTGAMDECTEGTVADEP